MKKLLWLSAVVFSPLFISSCGKDDGSIEDLAPETIYIGNAGITDLSQITAVNNFADQLRATSLWPKLRAIYPMIGHSANAVQWNMKDPKDTSTSFRLSFHGSPVFTDSGVFFPSLADFADTHLPDSAMAYNDCSISFYSMTQNTVSGYDMGCSDDMAPYNELAIYHANDASEWFGFHSNSAPASTKGLFTLSATSSDVKRYNNGVIAGSKGSSPENASTTLPVLIGKVSNCATNGQRVCAFVAIGQGLSDTEAATFSQVVTTFERALNRK